MNTMKILAIDDNADNIVVLKALLTEAFPTAQIFSAQTGKKGIELCHSEKPDVILLDIVMPEMDGYEVCQTLKANPSTKIIPIVMITAARTDKESRIKALEYGADAFLTKPVDESELTAQIRAMLRIKESEDRKLDENERLQQIVTQRTKALQKELKERELAERALKDSEERFRHISSSISDISYSCVIDTDGNSSINWLYGATEKITGYTTEELFEMKCWGKLVINDDFHIFKQHIIEVQQDKSDNCQLRLKNKDGNIVWIQASAECAVDKFDSNISRIYGGLVDITERKRAEEALLESEFFFKESQRAAFIGSYKFDVINDFWTSSEVLEQIFGIGQNHNRNLSGWINLAHPDDKEMMQSYLTEEVITKHKPFNKEYRIIRQTDSEIRWVLGLGKLDFDSKGVVISMIGTIQDITERKHAEEALRESNEFNSSLMKTIPFGMDIVDEEGNVLFQSEKFRQIFGGKAIGCKCWDIYRDDKKQCIDCPLHRDIHIGETATYEATGVLGERIFEINHTGMMFRGKKALLEIFQDITERKKSELALKESEEQLKDIFNNLQDAFLQTDSNGLFTFISPSALNMYGYSSADELIGQPAEKLYADPKERLSLISEIRKTGRIDDHISQGRKKDGTTFWISKNIQLRYNADGEILGTIGVIRDVTDRKQYELALKQSEERYRGFISQVSEGVYRFESDLPMDLDLPVEEQVDFIYDHMHIAECNDAFIKMYGITDQKEMIGKGHLDFHGGRNNPVNRNTIRTFIMNGYRVENAITEEITPNGQRLSISNNSIGIIEHNHLVRLWGTQSDITEKLRKDLIQQVLYDISNATLSSVDLTELIETISGLLAKLFDFNNFYIAFYDEASGMLSTLYEKGDIDNINSWPAEKSLTGYVIKNQISLLINANDILNLREAGEIEIVGVPSKIWMGVPLIVNKNVFGAIVVQSYENPNAFTENDKLMLEFISHQISISIERKRNDQDLKEALVKAQESDRLKSAFLANMSHEIRTPLNSIIGFSDLLLDPNFETSQHADFAGMISASGNNLLAIINDIVDISKIEAGQVHLKKSIVSVQDLIKNIQKEYSYKAREKGIELRLDPANPKVEVYLENDEIKLKQVLINLVSNALKFTEKGFIEIGFKENAKWVEFSVKDTGIGISAENHDTIFERFRQVESAESRKYGGNGLGLAISKSLIGLMGGEIGLISEPEKGSTFYFNLPISQKFKPKLKFSTS